MSEKEWFKKKITPEIIHDNNLLIKVFVVFLIFESLLIFSEGKSMLEITMNPNEIKLRPFFSFLLFLVGAQPIHYLMEKIKVKLIKNHIQIFDKSQLYTIFLLAVTSTIYFVLMLMNSNTNPFGAKSGLAGLTYLIFVLVVVLFAWLIWFNNSEKSIVDNKTSEMVKKMRSR